MCLQWQEGRTLRCQMDSVVSRWWSQAWLTPADFPPRRTEVASKSRTVFGWIPRAQHVDSCGESWIRARHQIQRIPVLQQANDEEVRMHSHNNSIESWFIPTSFKKSSKHTAGGQGELIE